MEKLTKLSLNRETIATLNDSDLSFVQGAGGPALMPIGGEDTKAMTCPLASNPNGSCNC